MSHTLHLDSLPEEAQLTLIDFYNFLLKKHSVTASAEYNSTKSTASIDENASLQALVGIWKDRDISQASIRQKAWQRTV